MTEHEPAESSPNGTGPAFQPNAAELIGHAVGQRVAAVLAQVLPQALAQVLQQIPVRIQPGPCAPCMARRVAWENRNHKAIEDAIQTALNAAGVEPGSPQAAQLDFHPFLPDRLRPDGDDAAPEMRLAQTTVGGTDVCVLDIPQQPGAGSGLAVATVNPAAMAGLMRPGG